MRTAQLRVASSLGSKGLAHLRPLAVNRIRSHILASLFPEQDKEKASYQRKKRRQQLKNQVVVHISRLNNLRRNVWSQVYRAGEIYPLLPVHKEKRCQERHLSIDEQTIYAIFSPVLLSARKRSRAPIFPAFRNSVFSGMYMTSIFIRRARPISASVMSSISCVF
jgi:hypothetical protein